MSWPRERHSALPPMPHAGVARLAAGSSGLYLRASADAFLLLRRLTCLADRRNKRSAFWPHEPATLSLTDAGLPAKKGHFQLPAFSNSKLDAQVTESKNSFRPQPTWMPGPPPGPSPASGSPTLTFLRSFQRGLQFPAEVVETTSASRRHEWPRQDLCFEGSASARRCAAVQPAPDAKEKPLLAKSGGPESFHCQNRLQRELHCGALLQQLAPASGSRAAWAFQDMRHPCTRRRDHPKTVRNWVCHTAGMAAPAWRFGQPDRFSYKLVTCGDCARTEAPLSAESM